MKRITLIFLSIMLGCLMPVMAQFLINQTSYVNVIPQTTFHNVGTIDVGNGAIFTGNAVYTDGVHTGYQGNYTFPDRSFLVGRFTTNFQPEGILTLVADNKQWRVEYRNGQLISRTEIQVQSTNMPGYLGPTPVGGYTNPVDNHTATCRGCNSTGLCGHCGGRGSIPSGSQCSLCHGTGRCITCGGSGSVRL